jgi:Asp-tRNA(Asn)/Glu-tRNA(Gln) amidotransferase A subunit family amidase
MGQNPILYDPATFKAATFFDAVPHFRSGDDDPRRYLERCLEVIAAREPVVKAWVVLNERGAREAADASASRWRSGRPLSPIDGMPIGIKDLLETKDMPTQMGCAAFEGNFPKRDSALIRALREAGAVVLGKTVTTELGFLDPGPTTNPFDPNRTPGGSSSGSAAAVGAGMIPVAIGTQVIGSVMRPASFCGNWALKPTYGALNRGERLGFSQSHIGVHAGSPVDMWQVAIEIARRAGGDPGYAGLFGPLETPAPVRPRRLVVMETEGWPRLDAVSREVFESMLQTLRGEGVEIVRRSESAVVEAFERSIEFATKLAVDICAFEQRWSLENLVEQHPEKMGSRMSLQLENGRRITLDDYRELLHKREEARHQFTLLAPLGDAVISLSSVGPAPFIDVAKASPFPTGDVAFACPSSILGAPAVNMPVMSVSGMPVGMQVLGQLHADAQVTGIGQWLAAKIVE